MRHLRVWTALVLVVLWGLSFAANAGDNYDDKWSPAQEDFDLTRPGSMGRAFIGIAEDNAAIIYNPAGMAQKNIFNLSFEGALNPATGKTMSYAGSILDSVARPVVMELSYSYQRYESIRPWTASKSIRDLNNGYAGNTTKENGFYLNYGQNDLRPETNSADSIRALWGRYLPGRTDRHTLRMAIGGSLGDYFHMATTIKYTHVTREGRAKLDRVNADLGFLLTTDVGLRIGTVLYNLSPWTYQQWPLKFGFGFAYVIKDELYIDADLVSTFNVKSYRENFGKLDDSLTIINTGTDKSPHYLISHVRREYTRGTTLSPRFGLEYIILRMVALRTGYEWDQYDNLHYVTGGAAWRGETYSIGVGYSQSLPDQAKRSVMFNFDFQL